MKVSQRRRCFKEGGVAGDGATEKAEAGRERPRQREVLEAPQGLAARRRRTQRLGPETGVAASSDCARVLVSAGAQGRPVGLEAEPSNGGEARPPHPPSFCTKLLLPLPH